MLAKSISQLLRASQLRRAGSRIQAAFVGVGLTLLVIGAAWLLDAVESQMLVSATEEQSGPPGAQRADAAAASAPEADVATQSGRYRALSEFLAKRYKVSEDVTLDLVTFAHSAGQQFGLDPLLIIAVMAVESRFNPIAESVMGAKGLMQVIPKYHTDKFQEFGGVKTVFDPETNIIVGSQILKEYLKRTGSLNTALRLYGGAVSDENNIYPGKVMNEKLRLQKILRKSPGRDVKASIADERLLLASVR